jgi:hypothetical protein
MTSPAYIPLTSATSCSYEMGLVSGSRIILEGSSAGSSSVWPTLVLFGARDLLGSGEEVSRGGEPEPAEMPSPTAGHFRGCLHFAWTHPRCPSWY